MVTHKCCVTKIVAYLMSINDEVIVIVKYIVTKGAKLLSLILVLLDKHMHIEGHPNNMPEYKVVNNCLDCLIIRWLLP